MAREIQLGGLGFDAVQPGERIECYLPVVELRPDVDLEFVVPGDEGDRDPVGAAAGVFLAEPVQVPLDAILRARPLPAVLIQ